MVKITKEFLLSKKFFEVKYDGRITGYADPEHIFAVFFGRDILNYLQHHQKISEPVEFILPKSTEAKYPSIATRIAGAITEFNIKYETEGGKTKVYIDNLYVFDPQVFRYHLKKYKIPIRAGKYKYYYVYDSPYGLPTGIVLVEIKEDELYIMYAPSIREVDEFLFEYPRDKEFIRKNSWILKIKEMLNEYIKVYANREHKAIITDADVEVYFPNSILYIDVLSEFKKKIDKLLKEALSKYEGIKRTKEEIIRLLREIGERVLGKYVYLILIDDIVTARVVLKPEIEEKIAKAEGCNRIYLYIVWRGNDLAIYWKGDEKCGLYETALRVIKPQPDWYTLDDDKLRKEIEDFWDIVKGVIENKLRAITKQSEELLKELKREVATKSTEILAMYKERLEKEIPYALRKYEKLGREKIKEIVEQELKYRGYIKEAPAVRRIRYYRSAPSFLRKEPLYKRLIREEVIPRPIYKPPQTKEEIPEGAVRNLRRILELEGFKYRIVKIPSDPHELVKFAIAIAINPKYPYSFRSKILDILRLYKLY